ncbi:MAG: VOC family protein [Balneola sp.]
MDSISPDTFVNDLSETVKFYQSIGFETIMTVPEEGDFVWVMMSRGNVSFMFQTFESLGSELPEISREDGGSLLLYIQLTDVQTFYDQIKDKANIVKDLEETFYGATEFAIRDLNNYVLTFAEYEK